MDKEREGKVPEGEVPEKKKGKVHAWFAAHRPTKRRLIQLYAALLTNANVRGFARGRIYQGATKNLCVPGLNCYSCPGAIGACPLGSLQNALAASGKRAPFFVIGILLLFGLILGRSICGFLCPVGLGQELLYKIPTPKLKKGRVTRVLSYFKYVLLAVLVIAIPFIYRSVPAFCKYVCPAGTFGGALALLVHPSNSDFFVMLGGLFSWKLALLVTFIVGSIFIFRFFCRFFCPLGAIYGFFNKIALLGVRLDKNACIDCGKCISVCKMDVKRVGDHECINCGECISVCPTKAIHWKGEKLFVRASEPIGEENAELTRPLGAFLPSEEDPPAMSVSHGMIQENAVPMSEGKEGVAVTDMPESRPPMSAAEKERKRNKILRFVAWGVALLLLAAALVYYNFLAPAESGAVYAEGDRVPDVTLTTYSSRAEETEFSTLANHGRVMVINFWYTTCDPCVEELPYFAEVAAEYEDVLVVAVHDCNVTEDVQKFLDGRGWNEWEVLFALDTEENSLYTMLGGKATFPMTAIIDTEGRISFLRQGKLEESVLRSEIQDARGATEN